MARCVSSTYLLFNIVAPPLWCPPQTCSLTVLFFYMYHQTQSNLKPSFLIEEIVLAPCPLSVSLYSPSLSLTLFQPPLMPRVRSLSQALFLDRGNRPRPLSPVSIFMFALFALFVAYAV